MSTKILDGQKVAQCILKNLAPKIKDLKARGIKPSLAVILIGDNPASVKYVERKKIVAESLGINVHLYEMLPTVKEAQLIKLIADLNQSQSIHGILVQLPLPEDMDVDKILACLAPKKDIDGLGPKAKFVSATALGIIKILEFYRIPIRGKLVVIIGRGRLVGRPLVKLMVKKEARVYNMGRDNFDIEKIKQADIAVVATGQAKLIKADYIKSGATVIDCGATRAETDFKSLKNVAGAITPVPGGVGPVTVATLMENLVKAAQGS